MPAPRPAPGLREIKPLVPTTDTRLVRPTYPQAERRRHKPTDKELSTGAHKDWRRRVIARANGMCQGRDHHGDRFGHRLVADHIVERRDGGALYDVANGQALCWSCHTLKTNAARDTRYGVSPRNRRKLRNIRGDT